jgi:hypothetical protein
MKRILLILLVILVIAQFFQPEKNNGVATAATDITHSVQIPDNVMGMLKKSCYDCHSNHTEYPWYNHITPVNWWLRNHINEGKRELNFTVFNNYSYRRKNKKLEEIEEQVEKHEMPLSSYTLIHTDAKLNDDQRKAIIEWTKTARQQVMQDSMQHVAAH